MSEDKSTNLQAGCIIAFAFTCVIVLVVGGIMGIVENRQNKKLPGVAALEASLDSYVAAGNQAKPPSKKPATATPTGMVVPIDVTDDPASLDFDILKLLPKANRPMTDADVQTIALLRYYEKEIPKFYDAGEPGYAYACEITLVDRVTKQVIAHGEVAGQPPAAIMEGQHSAGALDHEVVLAFVLQQEPEQ